MLKTINTSRSGFTIVELLIVIVVIAVLAAITVVSYQGIQARAHDSQKASNISNIMKVLSATYVTEGKYTPEIFISNNRGEGGGFNLVELTRLNHYGINPSSMHSPDAPKKMFNSFVFNKQIYNEDNDSWQKISAFNDSDSVPLEVHYSPPQGYSSWDDFYESTQSILDEYSNDYEATYPFPTTGNYEDEDAWYAGFHEYIKTKDPELYEIGSEGAYGNISVPKTALYIVDLLVPTGLEDSNCTYKVYFESGHDYTNDPTPIPELRCRPPSQPGYIEVTGIKISYYNKISKSWNVKTAGTGNPVTNYSIYEVPK